MIIIHLCGDNMFVTTGIEPSSGMKDQALRLAEELGCSYAERRTLTLRQLMKRRGDKELIKVDEAEIRWVAQGKKDFFFHPSMAALRVQRLMKGDTDALIRASGIQAGDQILDCTMGLGSDSIVLSYVAGETGHVTALESRREIHVIVREGMKRYDCDLPELVEAIRRIKCVWADHIDYLTRLPDDSFDIIYFDPMFRIPEIASESIAPLRGMADPRPLEQESIRQAVRVARKAVVLKEQRESAEFKRLGFQNVFKSGRTAYGVIHIGEP